MGAMWRLFWRTSRWEIAVLAVTTTILTVAALVLAAWMAAVTPAGPCLDLVYTGATAEDTASCGSMKDFIQLQLETSPPVVSALALLPLLAGVLLGSQLLAREIDHRTAVLSWSVVASRTRWLLRRTMPAGALILLVSLAASVASGVLQVARYPGIDIGQSFAEMGQWGPVLGVRGVMAFFVALLVGSVLGRAIPALLVSAITVGLLVAGSSLVAPIPAATVIVADPGGSRDPAAIYRESVLQDQDGTILTFTEASTRVPAGLDAGDTADWIYTHFRAMAVIVPGREAPHSMLRDSAMLLVITLLAGFLARRVVQNRRPY